MKRIGVAGAGLLACICGASAFGQDENPPRIEPGSINYTIASYLGGRDYTLYSYYESIFDLYGVVNLWDTPIPFNPLTDTARELDIIRVTMEVTDLDLPDEDFFLQVRAYAMSSGPPDTPPLEGATDNYESYPTPDPVTATSVLIEFTLQVPDYQGVNQRRLRGEINWDVWWSVEVRIANDENPDDPDPGEVAVWDEISFPLFAIEQSALRPPDPPPFADAGTDQDVALDPASGEVEVTLDGRRTFDATNIGFDVLDENVFEKDNLQYIWEWHSGPVQITADEIVADAVNPAIARVTLDIPSTTDNPYVFRLLVQDSSNALPSTDTVTINVRAALPGNNAPVAVVVGPADTVPVGGLAELSAAGSWDPDEGDTENLLFHWAQTNEVGGELSDEQLRTGFQPLEGRDQAGCRWRATAEGTYYFQVLVIDQPQLRDPVLVDSALSDTATVSVQVVGTSAGGGEMSALDQPGAGSSSDNQLPLTPAGCGGGGLLPLAALPVLLGLMRGRLR